MKLYLVHLEPPSASNHPPTRLVAELRRTFGYAHGLLPFSGLVASPMPSTAAGDRVLGSVTAEDDAPIVVLPLADAAQIFTHGVSLSLPANFVADPSATLPEGYERRLAIQIMPADPDRFAGDFERMLRVIAPYDCEVSQLLRVVRTPMSARTCGERLLREGVLAREDRFVVAELTMEPWTARHARTEADCERL